jgi:tRNA(Ile)-lysidine synthase
MPVLTDFGLGKMLRPLLAIAKSDIQAYALQNELKWVEDPTNRLSDFDRNFLRNEVAPLLRQRWPALDKTVARSAQHCAEAARLIEAWGQPAIQRLLNSADHSLAIDKLADFSPEQLNELLRHWFELLDLKPPSQAMLRAIKQQLIAARDDANPQIFTQGHYLKKYRQRLYCLDPSRLEKLVDTCEWPQEETGLRLSNGYRLTRITASTGLDIRLWHAANVTLKPRRGGEKIKLPGRDGQHDLKKLFQETGIPPWERESRPLIFLNDQLAAVAGLWVAEWAYAEAADACYRFCWKYTESV